MTPAPTRQMRLPLTAEARADTDSSPSSPSAAAVPVARREESCPRCRGAGTPIRRRDIIARCVPCGLRSLHGDGVRVCERHACSFCGGTGLVCAVCHGTRWLRRVVFPVGNEAVRCGACSGVGNGGKEASQ